MCGSSASNAYGRAGSVWGIVQLRGMKSPRLVVGGLTDVWLLLPPALPPPRNDARQDGKEDHYDDDKFDVLVDARNVATEEVSREEHAPDPQRAADDVVDREHPVVHLGNPGHERREGADDWHEARKHDRLGAVLDIEVVRALDVLFLEEEGIVPDEDLWPGYASEPVVHCVAEDRRDIQRETKHVDIHVQPGGDEQACCHQQRVTGQEEAEEEAGLNEDDRDQPDKPCCLDQVRRVAELMKPLEKGVHEMMAVGRRAQGIAACSRDATPADS